VPNFLLRTEDGELLGEHSYAAAVWEPGDRIPNPAGPTLVVVEVRRRAYGTDLPVLVVRRAASPLTDR
jgi:hypothetical protein